MSSMYLVSAKALRAIDSGRSLKEYCSKVSISKSSYGICCETLKFRTVINQILIESRINAETLGVDEYVLVIMIYELLFGKKKIAGGGTVKRMLMDHSEALISSLRRIMESRGISRVEDLVSNSVKVATTMPKYIRVNELKLSLMQGLEILKNIYHAAEIDPDIPSLIVLRHDVKGFVSLPQVKSGEFIIQDKASCFPSQVLCSNMLLFELPFHHLFPLDPFRRLGRRWKYIRRLCRSRK